MHPVARVIYVSCVTSWYMDGAGSDMFINPRRACAARVTVVGLCVCLFVCLFVCLSTTILALQATRRLMSDTNSFSATRA